MPEQERVRESRGMNPSHGTPAYSSVTRAAAQDLGGVANDSDAVDVALVMRIRAKDPDALADFYDRWMPTVRGLAQRILGEAADTDEVVEEVFWQVWQQAERFETARGRVAVWLLTIARSRSLDRVRSRQRRRNEVSDTLDDGSSRLDHMATDASVDPGEFADQRARVAAALQLLPPDQRDVVLLAYFSGLSQAEIAEQLGLPLGTVKTRTRLAFGKLRESLAILWDDKS